MLRVLIFCLLIMWCQDGQTFEIMGNRTHRHVKVKKNVSKNL